MTSQVMTTDDEFIKEMQKEFLEEVSGFLEECEESYLKLDNPQHCANELDKIFRVAHSIKGTGAAVGFSDLASFSHCVEDCLAILRKNPNLIDKETISLLLRVGDEFKKRICSLKSGCRDAWNIDQLKGEIYQVTVAFQTRASFEIDQSNSESTPTVSTQVVSTKSGSNTLVKVDSGRIDAVLDLVGELVVLKGQLFEVGILETNTRCREILALLDKTARELQDRTLSMRLTSLRPLFLKVQRIVRDLSIQLDKPIDFVMEGEDIEIDRSMIEMLADPLVHIVRNAVDHGIESKIVRMENGKSERGCIRMAAKSTGGRIVIELRDDGKGIDRERVLKKVLDQKLLPESVDLNQVSDQEVYQYIFLPGFSTAEAVTDLSGRGVGLDVAKNNIEKLKGSISIDSVKGKGATFCISLPLTTAITDGIVVLIDGQRFVVPMSNILEIVELEESSVQQISQRQQAAIIRGQVLPIIPLTHILTKLRSLNLSVPTSNESKRTMILVIEHLHTSLALKVDSIVGQNQVVVKSLGEHLKGTSGLAGASILGDGKIALVLDVESLSNQIQMKRHFVRQSASIGAKVG